MNEYLARRARTAKPEKKSVVNVLKNITPGKHMVQNLFPGALNKEKIK
jgi:hypothetical protein